MRLLLAGLLLLAPAAALGEPPHTITIDGRFDDWAGVPLHSDPAHNEHDTAHKDRHDTPGHVEHADVDLLGYRFTHDAENLYAYFRARGVIGRTKQAAGGKDGGRFYAIVALDVDNDPRTGYWLHEGGFYPTSGGYDLNAELEWYDGRLNAGPYLNHCCRDAGELAQAYLDQSAGWNEWGMEGLLFPAGFVRLGPGTYHHYTEWVYHPDGRITFVRDKCPRTLGFIRGALSADGHELEMAIPMKGFLRDPLGKPLVTLGRRLNVSFSLEASGELAGGGEWASNTAAPIRGYVLEPPRR
jgi:hypothetical protein